MNEAEKTNHDSEYLCASSIAEKFGVCVKTVHRWTRASLFPPPVRLSRRCLRWRVGDIQKFLDSMDERNEQ